MLINPFLLTFEANDVSFDTPETHLLGFKQMCFHGKWMME
jgi:hypothetical protein